MFFGPDQRRKPPCGRASNWFGTPEQSRRGPGHALAAFGNQPARTWQAEAGKQKKRPNAANVRKRKQAQPSPIPVLLRFQEQIKGPENASIARFDGLCCYQTSSETSDVFGPDQWRKPIRRRASRRFGAGSMQAGHALAAFGNQSVQTWRRSQKPEKHSNAANTRKRSPAQAPFASISGANKRPQKCLHRTV